MKLYVTLLMVILCLSSKSQSLINKTDEFTGEKSKIAVVFFGKKYFGAPILGAATPNLTFSDMNGKHVMSFYFPGFNTQLNSNEEIKIKNCAILMKMESDTVLRFKADTSKSSIIHNGFSYAVAIFVELTDQQLSYLMSNRIKIFRFAVNGDSGADINLMTEKNKKEIQRAAMYIAGMQEVYDQE